MSRWLERRVEGQATLDGVTVGRVSFTLVEEVSEDLERMVRGMVRARGCERCGTLSLAGPHVCEHGVTPAPELRVEFTLEIDGG